MSRPKSAALPVVSSLLIFVSWTAFALPETSVRINEVLAVGDVHYLDEDLDREDWIELYNEGDQPVALNGYALSDSPEDPRMWKFPDVSIESGEYLVVFASGKDRRPVDGGNLHTNFKMDKDGDYLVLTNPSGQVVGEFAPNLPALRLGVSYGIPQGPGENESYSLLTPPTPGAENSSSQTWAGFTGDARIDIPRGFYDEPFAVRLETDDPPATIYYTTDMNVPSATTGSAYAGPISVTETTYLRFNAQKPGFLPSKTETHSYLLGVQEKRKGLPSISIVTAPANLDGASGLFTNPTARSREWERPVSIEYINPEDNSGFQIDAGLRLHGNDSIRVGSKPSMKVYMREDYGPGKLEYALMPESEVEEFHRLVLRSGHQDTAIPFIRDELTRRIHADMGHVASHGTFAFLYLNGTYRSYYNPVERLDENFARSWHGGNNDWDVIRNGASGEGDLVAWNELLNLVAAEDLAQPANYFAISSRLDLVSFVDYLLLNIYASMFDWPGGNWSALRERSPEGRFQFLVWDAEGGFGQRGGIDDNTIVMSLENGNSSIPNLYKALVKNESFRNLFSSRFQEQFYGDGGLTNANVARRFLRDRERVLGAFPNQEGRYIFPVVSDWVFVRRPIIVRDLWEAGLLDPAAAPSKEVPPLGQLSTDPPVIPFGTPDLNRDSQVDSRDVIELLDQASPASAPVGVETTRDGDWARWNYPIGSGYRNLVALDLDNDGDADLASVNANYSAILILWNDGHGGFVDPTYFESDFGAASLAGGDIDGDGFADLVTANDAMVDYSATPLLNRGDGSFERSDPIPLFSMDDNPEIHPRTIQARDFNGDGELDLFVSHSATGIVGSSTYPAFFTMLLNEGGGGFEAPVHIPSGAGQRLSDRSMVIEDLNGDGIPDIALLPGTDGSFGDIGVGLLLSRPNGSYGNLHKVSDGSFFQPVALIGEDVDSDGDVDLISCNERGGQVTLLFNDGEGGFSKDNRNLLNLTFPVSLGVLDFDGDGRRDLLVSTVDKNLFTKTSLTILRNLGGGDFEPAGELVTDENEISFPEHLAVADFDNDGDEDIGVVDEVLGTLTIFLNALVPGTASADINGDRRIDFLDALEIQSAWNPATGP